MKKTSTVYIYWHWRSIRKRIVFILVLLEWFGRADSQRHLTVENTYGSKAMVCIACWDRKQQSIYKAIYIHCKLLHFKRNSPSYRELFKLFGRCLKRTESMKRSIRKNWFTKARIGHTSAIYLKTSHLSDLTSGGNRDVKLWLTTLFTSLAWMCAKWERIV